MPDDAMTSSRWALVVATIVFIVLILGVTAVMVWAYGLP